MAPRPSLRSLFFAACIGTSACAPLTWGGSYAVINATPSQIVIEYDRALTNPSLLAPVAAEHCQRHGRQPYMTGQQRTFGIGSIQFDCR